MNLNALQLALKNQINLAVRSSGMTIEETREVIQAELNNLLSRAEILEIIPFHETVVGVSAAEMAEYIDRYQAMMEHWATKTTDLFQIVEALERLRLPEATTEISLITKLADLAQQIDLATRGTYGELAAAFHGDKSGKWERSIRRVKSDVEHANKQAQERANQPSDGMATAR